MVKAWRRARGFTLIELMIALAILAFLLLAAMPFTRDWVDGTRQMQARSVLLEGMAKARALGLRNPERRAPAQVVAMLDLGGSRLRLWRGVGGDQEWSGNLPAGVTLKAVGKGDLASSAAFATAGDAFACVALDNRGMRLPAAPGCSLPLTQERIAIGIGNQEPVYVDLL